MKKLIVISVGLLLILNQARAQSSYEIYDKISGSAVKVLNGALLTRNIKMTNTDYSCALEVKNISAVKCVSWFRKYYVNILPGTSNYFCWDGCYFDSIMVSKNPVKINPGELFEGCDLHYKPKGMQGESRVKYVIYNGANRNDSIGFEVIFASSATGIDEDTGTGVEVRTYPNPAGSFVKFVYKNLSGDDASIVIKNVIGSEISRIRVTDSSGEIRWDVSAYPDGIYFYSLEAGGQIRSARKLIIQH